MILGASKKIHGRDRVSRHVQYYVPFYSATQVLDKTEDICVNTNFRVNDVVPADFRDQYQELFWNNIRYFVKNDLPYDLFLPYRQQPVHQI